MTAPQVVRRYRPSRLDKIENVEDYGPGGLHPVHLCDTFAQNRYRVLHKLGHGGFSTVWLARDTVKQRYVSLKVLRAEATGQSSELDIHAHLQAVAQSQHHPGAAHITRLMDHFTFTGPNGEHSCLVFELTGPSLQEYYECPGQVIGNRRLRGDRARKAAFQLTQAVDLLHGAGIVHGDLTPSNVLLKLANIDTWTEDDLYKHLGAPSKDNIVRLTNTVPLTSAPQYVVEVAPLSTIASQWLSSDITLIDFGVSFFAHQAPTDGTGTPAAYAAPELLFDQQASKQSDIWALACTLFVMRAGGSLFDGYFGGKDEALENIVRTLGELPEPWSNEWQLHGKKWKPGDYDVRLRLQDIGSEDVDVVEGPDERLTSELLESPHTRLSEREVELLQGLLNQLLKYKPEERRSVAWILEHSWFTFEAAAELEQVVTEGDTAPFAPSG